MQITKGQLKKIITEEMENIEKEMDEVETLVESYSAAYEVDDESVSKEALIDFLEALDEQKIPKIALEAFMQNLPEEITAPLLKEVVEE
jgi:hypothetical protein